MPANKITDFAVLKALTGYISMEAKGFYLEKIFSANKNELIILLRYKEVQFCMEAYMDNFTSFIFFPSEANAGRNSQALFTELENCKFLGAAPYQDDRSFRMDFEGKYTLYFKMYGRNANVILFSKNKVVSSFRPQFVKDEEMKLPPNIHSENESQITTTTPYYIYRSKAELYLAMVQTNDDLLLKTTDVVEAVNFYAGEYFYTKSFLDKKAKLIQSKAKQKEHFEKSLATSRQRFELLESEDSYKIQADIIMANLHNIPLGSKEVELNNFYNDKLILIKLKRDVTPQKFAENLYRKSRRQEVEKALLLEKIISLEDKIMAVAKVVEKIEKISNARELRPFTKIVADEDAQVQFPFKKADINGYEVYIGKNAKSNDELLRYANKEDIWLHAKGVSGSHVIIRRKGKNPVPKEIIEKAASLAAWNSKGKNSGLCPVIYTSRKYIRKPKGAAPGAVVCEREEVIMVVPMKSIE